MKTQKQTPDWKLAEAEALMALLEQRQKTLEELREARAKHMDTESERRLLETNPKTVSEDALLQKLIALQAVTAAAPARTRAIETVLADIEHQIGASVDALIVRIDSLLRDIRQNRFERFQRAVKPFFSGGESFLGSEPFLKVWARSTSFTEIENLLRRLGMASALHGKTAAERAVVILEAYNKIPSI